MFGFAAAGEVLPPDVPEFTGIGKAHDPLEVPNHCGKLAAPHLGERASDARVAPAENTVAPAFPTRQFGVSKAGDTAARVTLNGLDWAPETVTVRVVGPGESSNGISTGIAVAVTLLAYT